jgi:ribosome biogenesis GTPase
MHLNKLGYEKWIHEYPELNDLDSSEFARIISVNKNNYVIHNGQNECTAETSGRFLFEVDSNIDMPTVGDWVRVQYYDDRTFAIINGLLPRRSLLKRKSAGKNVDYQLLAANVDTAFIIQSADNNFNVNRFERYLVLVHAAGLDPVFLLSKSDLASGVQISEMKEKIESVYPGCPFISFSNENGNGIDNIKDFLIPAETYCLLGSSGVGKSTLLNSIIGGALQKVNEVREKDSRGKHTTTSRQLFLLENGSMFIDSPGMRELGNFDVEEGIADTFSDIVKLAEQCRFNDCRHTGEKGCAVQEALNNGDLSEARYGNYLKIKKESDYYEMSYLEKRRRDKSFGKMVKEIMKTKKDKR